MRMIFWIMIGMIYLIVAGIGHFVIQKVIGE
jgi:hypothetical protein